MIAPIGFRTLRFGLGRQKKAYRTWWLDGIPAEEPLAILLLGALAGPGNRTALCHWDNFRRGAVERIIATHATRRFLVVNSKLGSSQIQIKSTWRR